MKPNTLTLALSPQGRGDLRIAPPLRGGDKGRVFNYRLLL